MPIWGVFGLTVGRVWLGCVSYDLGCSGGGGKMMVVKYGGHKMTTIISPPLKMGVIIFPPPIWRSLDLTGSGRKGLYLGLYRGGYSHYIGVSQEALG